MKIAIQGHPTRGKEVIQILESLGGKNTEKLEGTYKTFYYIDDKNEIGDDHMQNFPLSYTFYTLESFEKEFPFKIGDKVIIVGLPDYPKVITEMTWMDNEIFYTFGDNTWYNTEALRKLEMEKERNITLTLDKAKEWYKKGGELKEIALQAFSEQELNPFPRSWEEYNSKIALPKVSIDKMPISSLPEKYIALYKLEKLRDCWRQGWEPTPHQSAFAIKFAINGLGVYDYCSREFLSFKDRKTATEFLKCFRDLIEKAGDLI